MMGMKDRIFSLPPRDVSLEELVPEVNFYRRLEERLNPSFVRELLEDRANPSLLSPTRLPTQEDITSSSRRPENGWLHRWRSPAVAVGFYAQCSLRASKGGTR